MNSRCRTWIEFVAVAAAAIAISTHGRAHAEIEFEATWQPPTYAAVRAEVEVWLDKADASEIAAAEVRDLWPEQLAEAGDSDGELDLLDRVAESFAAVDPC